MSGWSHSEYRDTKSVAQMDRRMLCISMLDIGALASVGGILGGWDWGGGIAKPLLSVEIVVWLIRL